MDEARQLYGYSKQYVIYQCSISGACFLSDDGIYLNQCIHFISKKILSFITLILCFYVGLESQKTRMGETLHLL